MRKTKTKCGYVAYEADFTETLLLGGAGICDECNQIAIRGYLVPVLNHYMCPKCFGEWNSRAIFYEEDLPVEQRTSAYYESRILLDNETEVETVGKI